MACDSKSRVTMQQCRGGASSCLRCLANHVNSCPTVFSPYYGGSPGVDCVMRSRLFWVVRQNSTPCQGRAPDLRIGLWLWVGGAGRLGGWGGQPQIVWVQFPAFDHRMSLGLLWWVNKAIRCSRTGIFCERWAQEPELWLHGLFFIQRGPCVYFYADDLPGGSYIEPGTR